MRRLLLDTDTVADPVELATELAPAGQLRRSSAWEGGWWGEAAGALEGRGVYGVLDQCSGITMP